MKCCSQFPTHGRITSPFKDNIVLGYYDGPIEGIVRCSVCQKSWYYKLIAWDRWQNSRLFFLSELPESSFDLVQEFFRNIEPNWCQGVIPWSFASEALKTSADEFIDRIIAAASKPQWIVLGKSISARVRIREVNHEILDAITVASDRGQHEDIGRWRGYFRE
jgi:hypothetical protein